MNKTKKILVVILLIITIATKCSAITNIVKDTKIYVQEKLEVPYHYANEEKSDYYKLHYSGNTIYSLGRYNNSSNIIVSDGEECNNLEINHILKNGYPMQNETSLGCANYKEAYLATQEAIYCKLENKDINYYVSENEAGERIINAVKKILATPKIDLIKLVEVSDWNTLSNTEKYKEYKIQCMYVNYNYKIKAIGENVKITDINGNETEALTNSNRFRLVVPKNTDNPVSIRIETQVNGTYVQICGAKKNMNNQYVMPEIGTIHIEKESNVKISDAKVNILNKDENGNIIIGSSFDILDSEYNRIKENIQTDASGKATINLDRGNYYLKQTKVKDQYEINKSLINVNIQGEEDVNVTVTNTKTNNEEIVTTQKEINVKEETKNIKEKNNKEITNITTTNINREIINETNITNLNNVNNFINTINRKNLVNLEKENIYRNTIDEMNKQDKILDGENIDLHMTRSDYINHIDMLMHSEINVPILPVASK